MLAISSNLAPPMHIWDIARWQYSTRCGKTLPMQLHHHLLYSSHVTNPNPLCCISHTLSYTSCHVHSASMQGCSWSRSDSHIWTNVPACCSHTFMHVFTNLCYSWAHTCNICVVQVCIKASYLNMYTSHIHVSMYVRNKRTPTLTCTSVCVLLVVQ